MASLTSLLPVNQTTRALRTCGSICLPRLLFYICLGYDYNLINYYNFMLMRKVLLILIFLLSFAIISHSDPPEGYKYREYNFSVRDCHGQYLPGATATISDTTWVDMGASTPHLVLMAA